MNARRNDVIQAVSRVLQLERFQSLDIDLVEAIIIQESNYARLAHRFEEEFYNRYIKDMPVEKIKDQNPAVGIFISFATERHDLATSWGSMQIMGQVARERGFRGQNLLVLVDSDYEGILWGCTHLVWLSERYHKVEGLLSAWNMGSPHSQQGMEYAEKVMAHYKTLKEKRIA